MSLKSGAPTFGMPEPVISNYAIGQMARRAGLPLRCGGSLTASKIEDAQAAYESVFSLWGAINGGANMLMHGAGWLEGGLCCSYEKTIPDIDLLQMVAEFLRPVETSESELALDAIDEVGPAGQMFGGQ